MLVKTHDDLRFHNLWFDVLCVIKWIHHLMRPLQFLPFSYYGI
jgi:hypothetical protein